MMGGKLIVVRSECGLGALWGPDGRVDVVGADACSGFGLRNRLLCVHSPTNVNVPFPTPGIGTSVSTTAPWYGHAHSRRLIAMRLL